MRGGVEFRRHLEAFAEFVFIAASSGSGDVMKSNEAWKHFIKSASFKEAIENFPENSVKAIPESAKSATVAEIREVTHIPGRHPSAQRDAVIAEMVRWWPNGMAAFPGGVPQAASFLDFWDIGRCRIRDFSDLPIGLRGDGPCTDCSTWNNIVWFTDNVFWNAVCRQGNYDEPILCIPCFVKRARKFGYLPTGWRLLPEWEWRQTIKARRDNEGRPNPDAVNCDCDRGEGEEDGPYGGHGTECSFAKVLQAAWDWDKENVKPRGS